MSSAIIPSDGTSNSLREIFSQSRRSLDRAWERYLSGASRESLPVRASILDSWERCRSDQLRADMVSAPRLDEDTFLQLQHTNSELLYACEGTLADAAKLLAGTESLMLVTDRNGVVMRAVGDRATLYAGRDIGLSEGGDWRESSAGTNGIGTTLSAARPMLVHSGEHYCEGMKGWSCAAAPIFDPTDGKPIGVIDVSIRSNVANSQIVLLSVLGARRVEQSLLGQANTLRARLLSHALDVERRQPGDALLALDASGRLVHASSNAPAILRDRVGLDLLSIRTRRPLPGFQIDGQAEAKIFGFSQDWISKVEIEGDLPGYVVIIPASVKPAAKSNAKSMSEVDPTRSTFGSIVGASQPLLDAIERAKRVASVDAPVLVEGETGVGKELFARVIHGQSSVAGGAFIAFNCGAVSRELIGSELFGYAKGAFTGASAEGRAGHFEAAHKGTLCLDEIAELSLELQPYLLRVLEEGTVSRIGESHIRKVDVRVIAMTNRDLRKEVSAGRFRRDLYHRLAVLTVEVPPLRERSGDLAPLLAHFSERAAKRFGCTPVAFTSQATELLLHYDWPGNIRELRNVVESATLFASNGLANVDQLPREIREVAGEERTDASFCLPEQMIYEAIANAHGNVTLAAHQLGMSRSTLYRRMAKRGIDRKSLAIQQ